MVFNIFPNARFFWLIVIAFFWRTAVSNIFSLPHIFNTVMPTGHFIHTCTWPPYINFPSQWLDKKFCVWAWLCSFRSSFYHFPSLSFPFPVISWKQDRHEIEDASASSSSWISHVFGTQLLPSCFEDFECQTGLLIHVADRYNLSLSAFLLLLSLGQIKEKNLQHSQIHHLRNNVQ